MNEDVLKQTWHCPVEQLNLLLWSLLKFFSIMESSLCQNVRILNKRFPASIIVPFKFKCRPSLWKCDVEMLLWKMTFPFSYFKMLYVLKCCASFFFDTQNTANHYKSYESQNSPIGLIISIVQMPSVLSIAVLCPLVFLVVNAF